jgi:L-threonylcarbamoyladenylate synthase
VTRVVAADARGIAAAAEDLRAGRLVAFPTETVYGLGARARDPRAVGAVFRAKGRPADHPLIVHVASQDELDAWADPLPETARRLARTHWPGPLTLVVRRAPDVPDVVTGGQSTVAVRAPAHPVANALLRALGEGVAAPSANRFGRISPTTADHVATEFPDLELTILDGGPCDVGLESTILDLSGGRARLLRPGAVSVAELERTLGGPVAVAAKREEAEEAPRVPGRLASHYAPTAPLRLADDCELASAVDAAPGLALLLRRAQRPAAHRGPWRRLPEDPAGYGRGLYAALRALDAEAPPALVVERPPDTAPWSAVRDRLARAAGPRRAAPTERNGAAAHPHGASIDEEER